jgi:hypothetical protein
VKFIEVEGLNKSQVQSSGPSVRLSAVRIERNLQCNRAQAHRRGRLEFLYKNGRFKVETKKTPFPCSWQLHTLAFFSHIRVLRGRGVILKIWGLT